MNITGLFRATLMCCVWGAILRWLPWAQRYMKIVEAIQLAAEGIDATVISVPSIRPRIPKSALLAAIQSCPAAITVEEHNVNGGVGSLVAEVLAEAGCAIPLRRLGIPDGQYAIAADRAATRARHEMMPPGGEARPQAAHKKHPEK